MLNQIHPDDELLAELASDDPSATVDPTVTAHVSSCDRCTDLVLELGALRAALADLPDLQPSRPLQLIPAVEGDRSADRVGGWARRFFAPVLTAGAALALVGMIGTVGTTTTVFQDISGGSDSAAFQEAAEPEASAAGAPAMESSAADEFGAAGGEDGGRSPLAAENFNRDSGDGGTLSAGDEGDASAPATVPAERSPWPMVLFVGVALMIAAAGLRWILAPRSG